MQFNQFKKIIKAKNYNKKTKIKLEKTNRKWN